MDWHNLVLGKLSLAIKNWAPNDWGLNTTKRGVRPSKIRMRGPDPGPCRGPEGGQKAWGIEGCVIVFCFLDVS